MGARLLASRIGRGHRAGGRTRNRRLRRHLLSDPLPYREASFQTVFLNQVIGHLEPAVAHGCLREIHRVLRPRRDALRRLPEQARRRRPPESPHILDLPTPHELDGMLRDFGLDLKPMDHPLPGRLRASSSGAPAGAAQRDGERDRLPAVGGLGRRYRAGAVISRTVAAPGPVCATANTPQMSEPASR